jgi:O-antigen/teichoic acid export membrane protein
MTFKSFAKHPKKKSVLLIGMLWSAFATVINKLFSLISQFSLGYFLSVETYGVFAIVASSMIFVAVFQNSGISKVLISKSEKYHLLFKDYSAFNFIISILGTLILILLGILFSSRHQIDGLILVYFITAVGIPIIAMCTIYSSSLSVDLEFKKINQLSMLHGAFYYSLTIFLAWNGFEIFTFALATVVAAAFHLLMLKLSRLKLDVGYTLNPRTVAEYISEFRWVFLTGILSALAMRADFLILSSMLSIEELGYYYFGFMLVMSLTVLISASINQTLLPIFSKLRDQPSRLRSQFLMTSSGICILSTFLCLIIILIAPVFMQLVWGGKWSGSNIIVIFISMIIPIRLTSVMAAVVLESNGEWTKRTLLTCIEIFFLVALVWYGAHYDGLRGACIGIATQRVLSGIIGFPFACKYLGITSKIIVIFFLKTFSPFIIVLITLTIISPEIMQGDGVILFTSYPYSSVLFSVFLLLLLTAAFNSEALRLLNSKYKFLR